MTPRLDSRFVEAYWRDGYRVFDRPVFSQDKFDGLSALFEELHAMPLEEKRRRAAASTFRTDWEDASLQGLNMCHLWEQRLLEWLLDDEVIDLVTCILGPDVALFSSHFICKDPADNIATPWHDDRFYWKPLVEPMDAIVTVWLALDDSDVENGCMWVVRGSHEDPMIDETEAYDPERNLFSTALPEDKIDASKAVPVEVPRACCSLHDARLIHGAQGNTSPRRRCGYTMRYFSTALKLLKPVQEHPTWLARGRDRAGNRYVNGPG
ncbi:MAG: phytanoyl-CoA dioxygenase [Phycisphaeraceae bacterium]|nr:phytanoyl-CoA dioxygenase [Phycisphaeraceae bacterium]